MCFARASSARLPRSSTGGLEVSMGSSCLRAAAASAVDGAALVAMRPALKTGKLSLVRARREGPGSLASLLRNDEAFARVPGLGEGDAAVGWCLPFRRRGRRATKTTEPRRSLQCFVASAAPRWVSGAWRQ